MERGNEDDVVALRELSVQHASAQQDPGQNISGGGRQAGGPFNSLLSAKGHNESFKPPHTESGLHHSTTDAGRMQTFLVS